MAQLGHDDIEAPAGNGGGFCFCGFGQADRQPTEGSVNRSPAPFQGKTVADLDVILSRVVGPGLALLPSKMDSAAARVMLLAIGLQESRFIYRDQVESPGGKDLVQGPALGYWQEEKNGGVRGVLNHAASSTLARAVCAERGVEPTPAAAWVRLETDDLLACAFARLLLWTDAQPLPAAGYGAASWNYYLRTWRPGAWDRGTSEQRKALRAKWDRNYAQAVQAVGAVGA